MIEWVVAFTAVFLLDLAFGLYVLAMGERNLLAAGTYAALIQLCIGVTTLAVVANPWVVLAMAMGGFAGTAASLLLKRPSVPLL